MSKTNNSNNNSTQKDTSNNVPESSQSSKAQTTTTTEPQNFTTLFQLSKGETPFLIGAKGRNISLIRKFSGMLVSIKDQTVVMTPSRNNPNKILAWRMIISACYGGILRWFETPFATRKGYPDDKSQEYIKLASSFDCELELMRSRRGHMCLILVPHIILDNNSCLSDDEREQWADKINNARQALLSIMNNNV